MIVFGLISKLSCLSLECNMSPGGILGKRRWARREWRRWRSFARLQPPYVIWHGAPPRLVSLSWDALSCQCWDKTYELHGFFQVKMILLSQVLLFTPNAEWSQSLGTGYRLGKRAVLWVEKIPISCGGAWGWEAAFNFSHCQTTECTSRCWGLPWWFMCSPQIIIVFIIWLLA